MVIFTSSFNTFFARLTGVVVVAIFVNNGVVVVVATVSSSSATPFVPFLAELPEMTSLFVVLREK